MRRVRGIVNTNNPKLWGLLLLLYLFQPDLISRCEHAGLNYGDASLTKEPGRSPRYDP